MQINQKVLFDLQQGHKPTSKLDQIDETFTTATEDIAFATYAFIHA